MLEIVLSPSVKGVAALVVTIIEFVDPTDEAAFKSVSAPEVLNAKYKVFGFDDRNAAGFVWLLGLLVMLSSSVELLECIAAIIVVFAKTFSPTDVVTC